MSYLRQPIIAILGHVDHGKTSLLDYVRRSNMISKEAGGITQHIGATEVSKKDLAKVVTNIPLDKIKIPGLLFIDTPGHKAFTSLRKRGGSICDIGILIVDINEGFKPQTIEAIEILRSMKTPFVIAANKVDLMPKWKSKLTPKLLDSINKQDEQVVYHLEQKVYELVGKMSEFGYESDRFDRVQDFKKQLAIVPISAKSGEGMPELLSTVVGLTQKFMESKLTIEEGNVGRGVILEVKDYPGLGKTIDVILHDGICKVDDTVLVLDIDEVKESKLKSILKPGEMKEIRDSSTKFTSIKEIQAASGVKLACPDLKDVKAGMPIICVPKGKSREEIESYKQELLQEEAELSLNLQQEGILVKADTLGSLEALSFILDEHNIPLRKALIGKVSKKDVMDAGADVNLAPKNAMILNFSQSIDDEVLALAKEYQVEVISSDIIYSLVDAAQDWLAKKQQEIERDKLSNLTMPFKIKILPRCIFRASNPAIVGCEVGGGTLLTSKSIMTDMGKKVGKIKSIKDKDDSLKELKYTKSAAVAIEDLVIGRHAEEEDNLYSFMGEENFRELKKNIDLLSSDEKAVLKEIAEIMRKENSLWGI
ncbi:MAG: translation initiation factor IF-2 [Nanoarchaeota archaeon]|nr:translation initiation factor IF-2 [Nanoarchaeota archaeon]